MEGQPRGTNIEQGITDKKEVQPDISRIENAITENTPEAEQAPGWFKQTVGKITDAWFDPKSFEENPELYEKLGVRTYKKYMPISGDVVYRAVYKKLGAPDWARHGNLQSLKNMERFTRVLEAGHEAGLAIWASGIGLMLANGHIKEAAFWGGMNMLVNVYPIMLQRYNRSRLYTQYTKWKKEILSVNSKHQRLTKPQEHMSLSLIFVNRFLTDERYNRGHVRQIWLFGEERKRCL